MTDLANNVASSAPLSKCGEGDRNLSGRPILSTRPHLSNRYHFGMLLGVDDLETDQSYHRGKHWLHQAWLHRSGVIWGLGVALHNDIELRVAPGLALDCRGRELCLDQGMCLDLAGWYDANRDEIEVRGDPDTAPIFSAHITLEFRACLERQVPALRDPCGDAEATTAYSRVLETVELNLVGGAAPDTGPAPYPRLRAAFGIDEPPEDWVAEGAFEDVMNASLVADSIDLVDERDILANERIIGERPVFPCSPEHSALVIATVDVELRRRGEAWELVDATIDNTVRDVLLDTSTIQSLLAGGVAHGPQLISESVDVRTPGFSVTSTEALMETTLTSESLSVSALDATGWTTFPLDGSPSLRDGVRMTVNVDLGGASFPDFDIVRLVARGTGASPILSDDLRPLAGVSGQRSAPGTHGVDAVLEHRS